MYLYSWMNGLCLDQILLPAEHKAQKYLNEQQSL